MRLVAAIRLLPTPEQADALKRTLETANAACDYISQLVSDTNHLISKRLVAKAERTKRAIALEDLKGIRQRARVKGRGQRARHSNWAFGQLRAFINYKAQLAGIPIVLVDAKYTSQRCSACGHTERCNRKSRAEFCCVVCNHQLGADYNAAINIEWAAVNQPMVSNPMLRHSG
jgi:putative transposase